MFSRIQVALDGSSFSEAALPWAERLARAFDATLDIVHVHEPIPGIDGESWDQASADWSQEYLAEVAGRLREKGLRAEAYLEHGTPVNALVRHAERFESGLHVVATHGRGALSRAWLGSVADGLLRHAGEPVFLIRPEEDGDTGAGSTGGDISRIVLPLDGSEFSQRAIETAIPFAKALGAELLLVRVVALPMEVASPYLPSTVQMNREVLDSAKSAAAEWLEEQARRFDEAGIEVETRVAVAGQPARAICDAAAEADADLILMATHGRSGLGRALLGSTADKVVRSTHLPVLAIKPATEDSA